jgi:hypothetical protein
MIAPTAAPSTPRSITCADAGELGQAAAQSSVEQLIDMASMRIEVMGDPLPQRMQTSGIKL